MKKHNIRKTSDSYIVDEKIEITDNGILYWEPAYLGKKGDFPQWAFKLRDKLILKTEIKVTLQNLSECYHDLGKNIFVNGEILDGGFTEQEVAYAILNGCEVICK